MVAKSLINQTELVLEALVLAEEEYLRYRRMVEALAEVMTVCLFSIKVKENETYLF